MRPAGRGSATAGPDSAMIAGFSRCPPLLLPVPLNEDPRHDLRECAVLFLRDFSDRIRCRRRYHCADGRLHGLHPIDAISACQEKSLLILACSEMCDWRGFAGELRQHGDEFTHRDKTIGLCLQRVGVRFLGDRFGSQPFDVPDAFEIGQCPA